MPRGKMARHRQTGAHRAFGIRRDDAQAGASGFTNDHGIADVDVQLLELGLVKKAVAIVADATDEGSLAAKLREADDRVGHGATADQPGLLVVKALEQRFLLGQLHQPHRAALEAEGSELVVVQFEKNVHDGIAEAAELEFFHKDHFPTNRNKTQDTQKEYDSESVLRLWCVIAAD